MSTAVPIQLYEIFVGNRMRALDKARVKGLAESIEAIGLKTPITVRKAVRIVDGRDKSVFEVVAGHHRLEAMRLLKRAEVDCFVAEEGSDTCRLWEIDENLIRAELSPAERALHHGERKKLMERLGLVRAHGGDRRSSTDNPHLKSYADEAAETLGVHPDTIRLNIRRAASLGSPTLQAVAGTALDEGKELDALAKLPADEQRALADRAKAGEKVSARKPQRLAREPLNDFEIIQKQVDALMGAWNNAGPEAREQFLARIDKPVFDGTRAGRAA